jgi:hypothetical protein
MTSSPGATGLQVQETKSRRRRLDSSASFHKHTSNSIWPTTEGLTVGRSIGPSIGNPRSKLKAGNYLADERDVFRRRMSAISVSDRCIIGPLSKFLRFSPEWPWLMSVLRT